MSYQTYITEAVVCGSQVSNTSDKSFLLFTREAGMLWATARSVREEKSKPGHALQDFSLIRVSLVKGKSGWRIGSVEALGNSFMESNAREARAGSAYLVKLIRRYVHGESALPDVFTDLLTALTLAKNADTEKREAALAVFHVRLLARLGYVAGSAELTPLIEDTFINAIDTMTPALFARITIATKAASAASHL